MTRVRMAVIGCGAFGQHHLRVIEANPRAELIAAVDLDQATAREAAARHGCLAVEDWRGLEGRIDAAVVASPTITHASIASGLMGMGCDVLVEKPVASTIDEARGLEQLAARAGRVLQVGHLERFNPAVLALAKVVTLPLFFEIHRMSPFQPRSLDIDVVLDLMIHDIDLVLGFTRQTPTEVRAAGIRVLSDKVDIANARLAFPGGCVANLTASRVSTEKVRKLRLFQPHQYISIDYTRQDGVLFFAGENRQIGFRPLAGEKREPLAAQLDGFLDCVEGRGRPLAGGPEGAAALEAALDILAKIEEHGLLVNRSLREFAGPRYDG